FFCAPLLAIHVGFSWTYWCFALLLFCWLIIVACFVRDPVRRRRATDVIENLKPLATVRCWMLSLFYFLTFAGFLAVSGYLTKCLTLSFQLSRPDAGLRAAGFVTLATLARPAGGWLSDKIGARKVLLIIFPIVAIMAIFMACPLMITFTIGALGMAAAIGL